MQILLKFNTGIYNNGHINQNRRDIALKYLGSYFMHDLIALTPSILYLIDLEKAFSLLKFTIAFKIINYS
jgi:hypothetical protein